MSDNQSNFDIWWNSPKTRRIVSMAYSLGASLVILGAMFKILHMDGAGTMLMIGMSTESILFGLGVFDKPHEEMEWNKIFNTGTGIKIGTGTIPSLAEDDVRKLSEGIKNLSTTANQFASLSDVVGSTKEFVKNIDTASQITGKFISSQEALNNSTNSLNASYQGISTNIDVVERNTKIYAGKIDEINKNLSSINSMYEIHLKNIQAQSEGLKNQTESLSVASSELGQVISEVKKMKSAAQYAAVESENYKTGTEKLSKQIAELNLVYGNMLNAVD